MLRVVCLSEHFLPRVGGTVRYVHEICSALQARGIDLHLLVPGPRPATVTPSDFPYPVTWIDAGYPPTGDPSRAQRYRFCREANRQVQTWAQSNTIDVAHVLFGLFLMEELDTATLNTSGVTTVATVHNVPPMECARSWDRDALHRQAADTLRTQVVGWKNTRRLRQHRYSAYVTPSEQVRQHLAHVLPTADIKVIGHGVSIDQLTVMPTPARRPPFAQAQVNLLTVGGWVPHKRQHLIPATAEQLQARGLSFHWTVVGPAGRNARYKAAIDQDLVDRQLTTAVSTQDTVSSEELEALYATAHLYVQPSTEEGFCLTALDAAASGLPVIGSAAGALPDICAASAGRRVRSRVPDLAQAIFNYVRDEQWPNDARATANAVRARYSWEHAAQQCVACYQRARSI